MFSDYWSDLKWLGGRGEYLLRRMMRAQSVLNPTEIEDIITELVSRMFSGLSQDMPIFTGKKIAGIQAPRQAEFQIGWDNTTQYNDYQMRRSKKKEITGKITTQQERVLQENYPRQQEPTPKYVPDYEMLLYQNPDMQAEELEKLMRKYDGYKGIDVPRRTESQSEKSSYQEQRQPIRPKESMRDIIYNGVGVQNTGRVQSRRNNSNFKAQGYNYYGRG